MILLQGWKRACKVLVINDFTERVQGTDIKIISQEIFQRDPVTKVEKVQHGRAPFLPAKGPASVTANKPNTAGSYYYNLEFLIFQETMLRYSFEVSRKP